WRGIAYSPEEHILFGVIRAGYPGGTATVLPRITGPGFDSLFAFAWSRVAAPFAFTGFDIIGVEITADSVLPAGDTDDHFIFDYQGCYGCAVAVGVFVNLRVPCDSPGSAIECH